MRTIRKESRGFERARQVVRSRRKDLAGKVAELVVRREGASGGRGASIAAAAACSFKRFLRRCGGSETCRKVSREDSALGVWVPLIECGKDGGCFKPGVLSFNLGLANAYWPLGRLPLAEKYSWVANP